MRKTGTLVAAMALFVVAVRLSAQPGIPKAGPEHEHFKQFEGTWDATVQSGKGTSKGTTNYKVGLNGLWLLEHFQGEFENTKFEGMGAMSYDADKKKYVHVWIDSMATSPMVSEGTLDKATKTMTMIGSMPIGEGKSAKVKMVTQMKSDDEVVFTMNGPGPDGKEGEMFKITYKRRAK